MSNTIIDLNPVPDDKKGTLRQRSCIIGGLLIENDEGRRWFKDTFGHELASDHTEDISVMVALWRKLDPDGMDTPTVCLVSQCHGCHSNGHNAQCFVFDFLVITYIEPGPFWHDGVNDCDFVLDEQLKPCPGVKETEVKQQLKEFGVCPGLFSL